MIGFALTWDGQQHGAVWISGDTVLYDGVREVAERIDVGTAIVHLGSVHFPITGPVKYTMTAKDAIELCRLLASPHRGAGALRRLEPLQAGTPTHRARTGRRARRRERSLGLGTDRRPTPHRRLTTVNCGFERRPPPPRWRATKSRSDSVRNPTQTRPRSDPEARGRSRVRLRRGPRKWRRTRPRVSRSGWRRGIRPCRRVLPAWFLVRTIRRSQVGCRRRRGSTAGSVAPGPGPRS